MTQATTTTPFDTILVQSRDLFRDKLSEAVTAMLDGADAALTELSEKAKEDDVKKRYADTRDIAANNRDVIESQFRKRLTSEFDKRSNKVKKIGVSLSDISLDDLQLVGEDDLTETLKFNDMAAKLRRYCEEELGALDQRVGVLLGDATLQSEDNPFGPQVITDAYKQACQKIDCPLEIRMVFLKLFDDGVADTIRSTYKDVNELLVDNSILPKIRYGVRKNESEGGPSEKKEKSPFDLLAEQQKGEEAPVNPQDMFAQLAKIMAPGGAGGGAMQPGMGIGGIPLVEGAQLMNSLSQLQVGNLAAMGAAAAELGPILAEAGNLKNILSQLKTTQVGNSMSQVDAMTLDIVAMLFDEIFDDPKIPIGIKGLIGHLQLPILKVAIADKELFSEHSHPARQLLDTLGKIGLRLPADFGPEHPTFPKLEAYLKELVEGFQEKMEIFDKVRGDLEAMIVENDQKVAKEMESAEKELEQGEKLALAKVAAEDEIKKRVAGASHLPRPIVRFLALQWIKYLVITHAKNGKDSDQWKAAVTTMDDLLGSIAPKVTLEDRRALARVIPSLLKKLKTGVAESGIEDAVSSAFFQELMKCHTDLMNAPAAKPPEPVKAPAPAAAAAPAAPAGKPAAGTTDSAIKKPGVPAATDSALKKPAAPAAADAARKPATPAAKPAPAMDEELDFTAPVEVQNPFGTGKVAVSSEDLDFTAAQPEAVIAVEAPRPAPGGQEASRPLKPGEHEATSPLKPGAAARPGDKAAKAKPEKEAKRSTIRLPSAMVAGAWVEVLDQNCENRQPAKLHYVSPMKSHFLFVDRKGKKVYECSRSMLARRLKMGEVTLLDGEPDESLFDRVMGGLFGKLKAKGSAPAPARASA